MNTSVTATPPTTRGATVPWLDWGPEVFHRAVREDKLIVFDSGATWCHWCHVMDRVTYEDAEVIDLLTRKFIPVRIDRDRLPTVDAKYQRAPSLLNPSGRAGGWPLTVILSPEGHVLFKATFLPPRAGGHYQARTGLIEILNQVDAYWREHREEIRKAAVAVRKRSDELRVKYYVRPGELNDTLVNDIAAGVGDAFDPTHGGFGGAPKFFAATGLELLTTRAWRGDDKARRMLLTTLDAMARGGVHDQVGGGFHRYSVDARWHVPHFEKMAYDNAALLAVYADAYALTAREEFATVARRSLAWIDRVLRDPGGKGYHASQDADVGLDDDGDYFTWTVDEVRAVLGDDAEWILAYYGVDPQGDMPERPGRNVLHVPKTLAQHAKLTGRDEAELARSVQDARDRLLAARHKRTAPLVDKTIFADLNGMLIDAILTASRRLGDDEARRAALQALDALLKDLRDKRGVFGHYRQGGKLRQVGLLTDQAWMARALLNAYAATLDEKYLAAARKVADFIVAELVAADGSLLSAPAPDHKNPAAVTPRRSWEDSPTRSPASVAAAVLLDLAYLTDHQPHADVAAKALGTFAGAAGREGGTFLGGYALAVDRYLNGPWTVLVIAGPNPNDPAAAGTHSVLADTARRAYLPGSLTLIIDPARPQHAALLRHLGYQPLGRPTALVCKGKICLQPAFTPQELTDRLADLAFPLPVP